jgi:hypothetical protein
VTHVYLHSKCTRASAATITRMYWTIARTAASITKTTQDDRTTEPR